MPDFDAKKILVVGGSSGIGAAAIDAAVRTAVLDTGDEQAVEAFFATAGRFDHVVVSAAQTASGPVRGLPLADAYAAMESKFWGAYRVARAVDIAEGGSLTLVSGFLSVRPSKSSVLQGAINAALEALARGLALELAPVRVNAVSPGLIATPLWSHLDPAARQAVFEGAAARLPAGRVGQAEDVANAILYLAATPFATGSTVRVDGGGAIA